MNATSNPQTAAEQARDKKAALTEDRMHTDKVFYSNAQITKADWDLVFRKRGEKSAAALLDEPSGKSAERRTANGHLMVRPANLDL
jgi:hypothetical protein